MVSAAEESDSRIRSISYDSTKCIGCHACEKACKEANKLAWDVVPKESASTETATTSAAEKTDESLIASSTIETVETTETTDTVTTTTTAEYIAVNDDLDADSWVNVKVWERTLTDSSIEYLCIRQACMHCGSCAEVCPAGH
jgi:Fe-S-cluster-containing dehydrogenase component